MAVRKDFRGKCVAQQLLYNVMEYAKLKGFSELYLATSLNLIAANKFYLKHGFEKIETLPKEIPTPIAQIYFMKKL